MIFCVPGGMMFGIMYAVYGLGFWYGIKLIMDDRSIYTSYLFTVGSYVLCIIPYKCAHTVVVIQ
jgi:hypothetical protein